MKLWNFLKIISFLILLLLLVFNNNILKNILKPSFRRFSTRTFSTSLYETANNTLISFAIPKHKTIMNLALINRISTTSFPSVPTTTNLTVAGNPYTNQAIDISPGSNNKRRLSKTKARGI